MAPYHVPRDVFEKRFWSRVDQRTPDECWLWTGYRMPNGYGMTSWPLEWLHQGRVPTLRTTAHRIACYLSGGLDDPMSSDVLVLHSCDNRPCCNPKHLRSGTQTENMRDMQERGRRNSAHVTGERSIHAKLTEGAVREIRVRSAAGERPHPLAVEYGVSIDAIWAVTARRSWQHVA